MDFYSRFIKPGDLCFDIGANVGNRTDVFLRLGGRVVAVEPQPEVFRTLQKRYGDNAKLTALNLAVGSTRGTAELFICSSDPLSSMSQDWMKSMVDSHRFPDYYKWDRKVSVQVETLDDLISSYGTPKFCKIDIEGYEFEVVKGLTSRLPAISFEFASQSISIPQQAIERLEALGQYEYNYDLGEVSRLASENWLSAVAIRQYLTAAANSVKGFGDVYARLKDQDQRAKLESG